MSHSVRGTVSCVNQFETIRCIKRFQLFRFIHFDTNQHQVAQVDTSATRWPYGGRRHHAEAPLIPQLYSGLMSVFLLVVSTLSQTHGRITRISCVYVFFIVSSISRAHRLFCLPVWWFVPIKAGPGPSYIKPLGHNVLQKAESLAVCAHFAVGHDTFFWFILLILVHCDCLNGCVSPKTSEMATERERHCKIIFGAVKSLHSFAADVLVVL